MPKEKAFNFTVTQSSWLEQYLAKYIELQDGELIEETAPEDFTRFFDEVFNGLEAKFEISKSGTKERILMVRLALFQIDLNLFLPRL